MGREVHSSRVCVCFRDIRCLASNGLVISSLALIIRYNCVISLFRCAASDFFTASLEANGMTCAALDTLENSRQAASEM